MRVGVAVQQALTIAAWKRARNSCMNTCIHLSISLSLSLPPSPSLTLYTYIYIYTRVGVTVQQALTFAAWKRENKL